MKPATRAIHGGYEPDPVTGATAPPIFQTVSYAHRSAADLEAVFAGGKPGFVYTRLANPTTAALERRIADLEGGIGAIACASGMAAIAATAMALLESGGHVVAASGLFGGTVSLLARTLARFGVETSFAETGDAGAFRKALRPATRFILVETIANPQMDVPDLEALAAIAREAGLPLIADSTLTTPCLIRPGEFGAAVVIHSTSKFIDGHGNAIGGAIVDTGRYDWTRFPSRRMGERARRFGPFAFLAFLREEVHRDLGGCPSPFNSFLHLEAIESLPVRMERHCANALSLARWLEAHPRVRWVKYPGLESSRYRERAARLFGGRFGGLLAFGLEDRQAAFRCIDGLRLAQRLANLGDAKTLVIHPASTIFHEFSAEERAAMGIGDEMIRVSVGLEDVEDIQEDFERALRT